MSETILFIEISEGPDGTLCETSGVNTSNRYVLEAIAFTVKCLEDRARRECQQRGFDETQTSAALDRIFKAL